MIFVPTPINMTPAAETVAKPAFVFLAQRWTQSPPQTAVRVEFNNFVGSSLQTAQQTISQRIKYLSSQPDSWLDGAGQAMPPGSSAWLIEHFAPLDFGVSPAIFPTPEGNVSAEWSIGPWEASAEIDLKARTVTLHALDTETLSEKKEVTFRLDTTEDWKRIPEFINGLIAP